MTVFFPWTNIQSTIFDTTFDRACFAELGYSGFCIPHPNSKGCSFTCGAYHDSQIMGIRKVFEGLVESLDGSRLY